MTDQTKSYERTGVSSTENTPLRRGEHFTDPVARAVWAAILTLSVALQHEILRALRQRLAFPEDRRGAQSVREARAVAALREAAEILEAEATERGEPIPSAEIGVSEREYRRLRDAHYERGWPEARSLARWLGDGTWNDALARAGLAAVDDPDTVWRQESRGMTQEEIHDSIREAFAAKRERDPAATDITFSEVMAHNRRAEVRHAPGRRPRSLAPFRRFGGFEACKRAALAGTISPVARPASPRPRSNRFSYTEEEVHAGLRAVAAELGHSPRATDYEQARIRLLEADAAAGRPPQLIASYQAINHRYGSWNEALRAAGLAEIENSHPNHITDEEIVAALRDAYAAKGRPFTKRAYEAWVREHGRRAADGRRVPAYACIYNRFRGASRGAWRHACALALPEGWDAR